VQNWVWMWVSFFTSGCTRNLKETRKNSKPERNLKKTRKNLKPERNTKKSERNPFTKFDGYPKPDRFGC
jgi:hypothetical protein